MNSSAVPCASSAEHLLEREALFHRSKAPNLNRGTLAVPRVQGALNRGRPVSFSQFHVRQIPFFVESLLQCCTPGRYHRCASNRHPIPQRGPRPFYPAPGNRGRPCVAMSPLHPSLRSLPRPLIAPRPATHPRRALPQLRRSWSCSLYQGACRRRPLQPRTATQSRRAPL